MSYQRGQLWPISGGFHLTVHDARNRVFYFTLLLHNFLIGPPRFLRLIRMPICMGVPILVPSYICVPVLRLPRSDILCLGIRVLSTNYQPQSCRVLD